MSDYDPYVCEQCGVRRIRVSGLVCPEGHGRIHYPTPDQVKRGRAKLKVPIARHVSNYGTRKEYMIEGLDGLFRRYARWWLCNGTRVETPGTQIRARLDDKVVDKVVKFVPIIEVSDE